MAELRLVSNQIPHPKARPKFRAGQARDGRIFTQTYKPKGDADAESDFLAEVRPQITHFFENGPLDVEIVCDMPVPKSRARNTRAGQPHISRPDLDNLVKFILDCLNHLAWRDDAQIAAITARKQYGFDGRWGTQITIRDLAD